MTAPPRRLTRGEQKARTREQLMDAAERVFVERGFVGASLDRIAEEAGLTRGAFHSNFESKEQLFFELLSDRAFKEYTRMVESTPPDMTPREQVRWGAEQMADRYARKEEEGGQWLAYLWLECLALAARDERFRELAANFWRGNRELVAQRFREGYEKAGVELPAKARDLASAMTALDIGLFLQHLVDPGEVPLAVYPQLYELLFGDLVEPG